MSTLYLFSVCGAFFTRALQIITNVKVRVVVSYLAFARLELRGDKVRGGGAQRGNVVCREHVHRIEVRGLKRLNMYTKLASAHNKQNMCE